MALAPDSTLRDTYRITYVVDDRQDSAIYRAMDRSGRRVLVAALRQQDAQDLAQAAALARQVATLRIAGLLALLDHFAEDHTYYLVCEDPGGQDLERFARERGGPLPEDTVLAQMDRLLEALNALHGAKPPLYIGELRSSDLWSNGAGELFLTPFPLARRLAHQDLGYRAPELSKAAAEPEAASDMYSFGVLFYQLLTGWLPPSAGQREAGTPLNAPRALNGQISALAEQAALRSLELKKGNRYQVAREMRQALEMVRMMAGRSLGLTESLPSVTSLSHQGQPAAPLPPAPAPTAPAAPQMPPPSVPQPPGYGPAPVPTYGPPQPPTTQQPAPGYGQPQQPYPQQPYPQQPYPQQAVAAPRQGNTCLILAVVTLGLLALMILTALAVVLLRPNVLNGLLGQGSIVAATSIPALQDPTAAAEAPTPQQQGNPAAISLASVAAITETRAITESLSGPVAYAPDGGSLALGLGAAITLRNSQTLEVLSVLQGHAGALNTLAFSPDGTLLASGAIGDPEVRLWDVASGKPLQTLTGHQGWIRSLAFSPDAALLASGSTDQTIRLWDREGKLVRTLEGHTGFIGRIAFSPDGTLLASTSRDGTLRMWQVASGAERNDFRFTAPTNTTGVPAENLDQPYWLTGLAFSPDGSLVAAGSIEGNVRIWDVASGELKQLLEGHTDWVALNTLAFSPDGKTLASGSLDGSVRLWDPASGATRATLESNGLQVLALAFQPDGRRLATSSDESGALLIWDLASGQVEQSVRLGQGLVTSLRYSPDGALLGSGGVNGTMRIYNVGDQQAISLTGGAAASQSLAFSSSAQLAALTDSGGVVLIDLTKQQQPRALSGLDGPASSVAVSPDGSLVAAGSASGQVGLWQTDSGKSTSVLNAGQARIVALDFSTDGALLAVGSGADSPEVTIFDLQSGEPTQKLSGHSGPITALAFQPRGDLLATASRDGSLRLWNAASGEEVRSIDLQESQGWLTTLAFSPDGSLLVTGALTGALAFWNPATGDLVYATNDGLGAVLSMAFHPDGDQLAVSMKDGSVRLMGVER